MTARAQNEYAQLNSVLTCHDLDMIMVLHALFDPSDGTLGDSSNLYLFR